MNPCAISVMGPLCIVLLLSCAQAAPPPAVVLARGGTALMPVVIAPDAPAHRKTLAETLAKYLERISGARFEVVRGDGQTGVALGTAGEFPAAGLTKDSPGERFGADEAYLLRSHSAGLYAVGVSELAVQHAAYDLLHRLGCRWYFPGEIWEVIPAVSEPKIAVDAVERPDYAYRSIWYGSGLWDYNAEPYRLWRIRNRAESRFVLRSGHSYDGILRHYKKEFAEHPEYLGLLDGKRKSTKFCTANPGLRALIVRYARECFQEKPEEDCVSIDPSDGGGWCQCDACRAMGSPSDRALTLANEISAMLEAEFPGKYVAMYAYNEHSPPPTISARARVIINCATAFIRGGYTIETIIAGWKAQGVQQFGIREYYGVNTWDRDRPHAGRGADLQYLARTIPQFHAQGARFLSAESSDGWGPKGLGYYLATRMLWDVKEAQNVEQRVDDFLQRAFGSARPSMARFYQLLYGPQPALMSHDLIGRMYRLLEEGRRQSSEQSVDRRLDDLLLYTRYVELFRTYENASGAERQAACEQLLRHAYRMRTTMMVHTKSLYRDLPSRDKSVRVPAEATWNVPEEKNPWKSSAPWSREELDRILSEGIANNRLVEFESRDFGQDLVRCDRLTPPDLPVLQDAQRGRSRQVFYTWFTSPPAKLALKVTGGLIAHYRDRGNVRLELYAVGRGGSSEELVDRDSSVPPDGKPYEVTLRSTKNGLHRLVVNDGGDMTEVQWPADLPRTIEASLESASKDTGRRSGYFYVPKGTRIVGGYAADDRKAAIGDGDGRIVFRLAALDGPDYFQIPVSPGQDGRWWSFRDVSGRLALLTVPPWTARHPKQLLLPRSVVEGRAPD